METIRPELLSRIESTGVSVNQASVSLDLFTARSDKYIFLVVLDSEMISGKRTLRLGPTPRSQFIPFQTASRMVVGVPEQYSVWPPKSSSLRTSAPVGRMLYLVAATKPTGGWTRVGRVIAKELGHAPNVRTRIRECRYARMPRSS